MIKIKLLFSILIITNTFSLNSVLLLEGQPTSQLVIDIPDYEVTSVEGDDYVEIPGGDIVTIVGEPLIPCYIISQDYPKGHVIQDVRLADRGGLVTDTGLNIPLCIPKEMGNGYNESESNGNPWFPKKDYEWFVDKNPNESTTLTIVIFPFYFNKDTTDVLFYKKYELSVKYIESEVEIIDINLDKNTYNPHENVTIGIDVLNNGVAKDVLVSISVRLDDDEVVDGLRLKTLKELEGHASYETSWITTGFEPGFYRMDVELLDKDGLILDRDLQYLTLGGGMCRMIYLNASPQEFNTGEQVNISMVIENVGSSSLSGKGLLQIQNKSGYIVKEAIHEFAELDTNANLTINEEWQTDNTTQGEYTIIGYTSYEGLTTQPKQIQLVAYTQKGEIKINVKDIENEPLEGILITSTSHPENQFLINGTTDQSGRITFSDIQKGEYQFKTTRKGYNTKKFDVSVKKGETAEVDIILEKEQKSIPGIKYNKLLIIAFISIAAIIAIVALLIWRR